LATGWENSLPPGLLKVTDRWLRGPWIKPSESRRVKIMIIKASAKFVRGRPRKVRLVTSSLIGLSPSEALSRLSLTQKKVSEVISKVIKQAMANAKNNFKADPENFVIKSIVVGEGPKVKRLDKSHSARSDRGTIIKRFFHIWVVLESKEISLRPDASSGLRRDKENGE